MRTLPDNPSLEFLRQEAKDLLVALRESTPTASLADAQKSLSEQYGFRTWPDLKARSGPAPYVVDRVARIESRVRIIDNAKLKSE